MRSSTAIRPARGPYRALAATWTPAMVIAMKKPEASRAASCRGSQAPKAFAKAAAVQKKRGARSR